MKGNSLDEVMSRIYNLHNCYIRDTGKKPTTVFVGHKEYYALLDSFYFVSREYLKDMKVMGMKVRKTVLDNYIAVGTVYEEEEGD